MVQKYKSVKGDSVDEAIASMFNIQKLVHLPIYRISQGKYLIGTDTKLVQFRGEQVMVRVGGGWEKVDEYIARNQ